MRQPWTLEFIREWWRFMDLPSILRLRRHAVRPSSTGIHADERFALNMRWPFKGRVFLRARGSDILTFNEVIKQQVYGGIPERLHRCRSIVDLGANIGLTSLYLAARFPEAEILALEPNPHTYSVLTTNLQELVSSGRCRTVQAAVWSANRALVGDSSGGADHFSAFATREAPAEAASEATITGLTMPQVIAESGFSFVDLVKVDIEGAEVELLKGDQSWLARVGAVAIEFHGNSRVVSGFDRVMAEHGFTVWDDGSHTTLATKES